MKEYPLTDEFIEKYGKAKAYSNLADLCVRYKDHEEAFGFYKMALDLEIEMWREIGEIYPDIDHTKKFQVSLITRKVYEHDDAT